MNKKLTLILLTNLVITGPMVTDATASTEPPLQELQTTTSSSSSSSSRGLSLAEIIEQLKQQVIIGKEHLSSIIKDVFDARKELETLREEQQRLRDQIKEKAEAASQTMPHTTTEIAIQADGPDTVVWDGTGAVPKDVTKVRIADGVKSIGSVAFSDCTKLTSVTIPNSVRNIGDFAFYNCSSLTNIAIPEDVRSIGRSAFYYCIGLRSVTILEGVESIGDNAFWNCRSLTSIVIPNSVTSIGDTAFWGCTKLTSMTIPNSVTSIGDGAFSWCTGLRSITMPSRFDGQRDRLRIPLGCTVIYY